jgi:putative transcriptional regulator
MRKFDAMGPTDIPRLEAMQVRDLRLTEGTNQAVFARYLNVTTGLISQWERGEKHRQGTSLKPLALVARNGFEAVA